MYARIRYQRVHADILITAHIFIILRTLVYTVLSRNYIIVNFIGLSIVIL